MEVSIYSQKEIEKLIKGKFPQNVAVISFYDPEGKYGDHEPCVDYKGKAKRVFQIPVYDVDYDSLEDYGLTLNTYLPEADKLASFIKEAYKEGLDIICQCQYGQSRSAGCAAAIIEYFNENGISIFRDYRYCPSQLIFNKVYEALKMNEQKIDRME